MSSFCGAKSSLPINFLSTNCLDFSSNWGYRLNIIIFTLIL
uniref:Uncharacterized protein n=1 Tax=Arundo donax TaxID=35708 RepID=A0A0A9FPJ1_ARUDO